ncbi:MAG: oligosaccharide flippase family protein [Candidatus Levybacteria bacterium]|nr:oligosaccharide flippase family protein [Candidatus Levybacteria bacterium]
MGYSKQAFIGISWMSAFRGISRVIAIGRSVLLARILTPAQFGVFGIASIMLSFLEILTETGINIFLIQQKENIDKFVSSAWIVSILRGILISLTIIITAPIVVNFFNMQDLYRFLYLISVVPLIRGFINPSIVKYQKDLEFRKEFWLRISVYLFDSATSVILALILTDAISFVWGLIAGAILEVILSFVLFSPLPLLKFELNLVKQIVNKGKWVTAYGIFNYIAQQGDTIAIGKLLGAAPTGIYQMGYRLSTLPISEVSDVVNRVVFPVYSKISDDKHRLLRAFKRTLVTISLPVSILSIVIFFLPKEFFDLLLGPKWAEVTSVIKILVIYGMFRAISGVSSSLFLSLGKQNFVAGMTFIRFFVLAATIVPLTSTYGIIGSSLSALLSVLLELPLIGYFILKIFKS